MSRPTSTRRWPDILIGVLVLLLLAGFAALLLGQRKTAATTTPTATATASATSGIPAAPGTAQGTSATPDTQTTAITPPVADPTAPADAGSTDTPPADPTQTKPSADTSTEAPIIPAAPTPQATTPQTTPDAATSTDTQPAATPTTETLPAETPAPQTETPQAQITETPIPSPAETPAVTTAAPRSGGAVATSDSRTPLRSDYRISLGTFGSVGTAQSRTAPVSTLGYKVYPIDLGSQVVAQVGPFADEASARQALGDIQRAYPGALLYPPRARASTAPSTSDGNTSENSSSSTSTSGSSSSSAPAASPAPASTPTASPTSPAGPIYLQVGAFDRVESAQKMVQQLRDLGYVPTVNAPDGRKVTVAVGPYTGDALTRTEQRLDDNNLDHFRVR